MTPPAATPTAPQAPGPGPLSRWLPVIAWVAVISVFSSDSFSGEHTREVLLPVLHALLPGAAPATLEAIHDVLRKAAHPGEYAVLGWLVARALEQPWRGTVAIALQALALCAAFAALDELHQSFVPSRGAAPTDVALDSLGAAAGLALRALLARRISAGRRWPA